MKITYILTVFIITSGTLTWCAAAPSDLPVALPEGFDVNAVDENGHTALHRAAGAGRNDKVKQLIDAKANLEAPDKNGLSALHYAASKNHVNALSQLIDAKANLEAHSDDGITPLMQTAIRNSTDAMDVLLTAKAAINAGDRAGDTALHWATINGHTNATALLIKRKADVNIIGHAFRFSPLAYATRTDNEQAAQLLRDAGAQPISADIQEFIDYLKSQDVDKE